MDSVGTILICGDVCPVPSNIDLFETGNATELFGEDILTLANRSCGVIFNLEVPLTDCGRPIRKSGPNLIASRASINALRKLPLACVGLANNHVLDQGEKGLLDTLQTLNQAKIPHVGAGANLREARRPCVVETGKYRIGVYACAEHEFTIAQKDSCGANPFDPISSLVDISVLANECDRTIVLFHGMKEHYRYPSPDTVRRCRAMADMGASIVVCQHSHCIGCVEVYNGTPILYGQGDFCFTKGDKVESRRTGLVILYNPATNQAAYVPVVNDGRHVRTARGGDVESIMAGFNDRSAQIARDGFVEKSWGEFCRTLTAFYANQIVMAIEPKWFSVLLRAWWKLCPKKQRFSAGNSVAGLLNIFQCEAHNEALRSILKERLNA